MTLRNVLKLDRRTHRYSLEPLSGHVHPKVMLASRLVGFYQAQLKSAKFRMRFLMRMAVNDKQTVLGRNLHMIAEECH